VSLQHVPSFQHIALHQAVCNLSHLHLFFQVYIGLTLYMSLYLHTQETQSEYGLYDCLLHHHRANTAYTVPKEWICHNIR